MIIHLNNRTDCIHLTLEKSIQSCLDLHSLVPNTDFFVTNNNYLVGYF